MNPTPQKPTPGQPAAVGGAGLVAEAAVSPADEDAALRQAIDTIARAGELQQPEGMQAPSNLLEMIDRLVWQIRILLLSEAVLAARKARAGNLDVAAGDGG